MQVINKELYHFHNNNIYDNMWLPNTEILVDDNFNTFYTDVLKTFRTSVNVSKDNKISFDRVIDHYLDGKIDEKYLANILKKAEHIIWGINICKREAALERVREVRYPNLPSRLHSIWLCDEDGLDFWEDALSDGGRIKLDLYKVIVTGKLFKSSDTFLPKNESDYGTNLIEAEEYWNPKFKTGEDELKAEYLFQGKVKVLEKLN